jgi:Ca2+-binding EF-hand superfamily protein
MKLRTIALGLAGVVAIGAAGHYAFHAFVVKPRMEAVQGAVQAAFAEHDADKDGKLSRGEVDVAIAARFAAADTSGDGLMDRTEFDAAAAALRAKLPAPSWRRRDPAEMQARVFKALDWNRDGALAQEEIKGPLQAAAGFADRDGDGFVAADELRRPWRGRHAHAGFF